MSTIDRGPGRMVTGAGRDTRDTSSLSGDGAERKQTALDAHEIQRSALLLRARRALLVTLLELGTATADDVRAAVEIPAGVDPVCLGAVAGPLVKAGIIMRAGYVETARPEAHACPVTIWELVDADAAERWLAEHPERDAEPPDAPRVPTAGERGEQRLLWS